MSQAIQMYFKLKSLESEPGMPEAMQCLYYSLLKEGCTVKSCKKKWFQQHYIVTVWSNECSSWEELHLTPEKIWWTCHY